MEDIASFFIDIRAILGAVLGIFITYAFHLVLKRIDFMNEHYKWVVKRRTFACESIELCLRPFLVEIHLTDVDYYAHNAVILGIESHPLYHAGLEESLNFKHESKDRYLADVHVEMHYVYRFTRKWVSDSLSEALKELMDFISTDVDPEGKTTKAQKNNEYRDRVFRHKIAENTHEGLRSRVIDIQRLLFQEYMKIHDVKGFLKSRANHKPLP